VHLAESCRCKEYCRSELDGRAHRIYSLRHHFCGIAYQSFWTLTANPQLLSHARLRDLARQYGVEPAQILFRCLTQIGVTPLIGTTSLVHMQVDLAIFAFALSEAQCAQVLALFEPPR
jgi:diketogulonate reductase-like aldo/keto reductase